MIRPGVAPKLPAEQQRAPISPAVALLAERYSPRLLWALCKAVVAPAAAAMSWPRLVLGLLRALVPVWLALVCLGTTWWYVTIYTQKTEVQAPAEMQRLDAPAPSSGGLAEPPGASGLQEPPGASGGLQEPPGALAEPPGAAKADAPLQRMDGGPAEAPHTEAVPQGFYTGFAVVGVLTALLLAWYYWRFDAEQYEILNMLVSSVMPLGILTLVVLGVILFGITTATESAAVGAAGAFLMAWQAGALTFKKTREAVFLTAKTTAMVCWLFVGSALFSAVFALLGGQALVERWVLSMDLTPLQFMLLSQAIIFVLGWPLEWTEIIVIFVPIFLPLLAHFQIDPMLWGVLVFVNLQAAFLSPPVAMSAFYLKGVSPPHVTLNQIFAGMMPYMLVVILCMVLMYAWPGMTLWLPGILYK